MRAIYAGGVRKRSPSRSGAFAKTSSERQARMGYVLGPRVRDLERMRGRRNAGEVELSDLRDRFEDRRELLLEASHLVVGQLEPGEPSDMQDLFA